MLAAFGENAQGKGLYFGDGLSLIRAVAQHARKLGNLGNPPAILLAVQLDLESHEVTLASSKVANKLALPHFCGNIANASRI